MLIFLVIAIFFLIMTFAPKGKIYKDDTLDDLKMEIHKYSGVNPDMFNNFMTNMELMEDNISRTELASYYLYKAIDNAQEIALYTTGYGTHIVEEISQITTDIGEYSEQIILDETLLQGNKFQPRYLNEKVN